MEARGAVRLSLWTSLSLLLISGAAEGTSDPRVLSAGAPGTLDIPNCGKFQLAREVVWKKGPKRLLKKKLSESSGTLDSSCDCKLLTNGSLYVKSVEEGEHTYTVDVHDENGYQLCNSSVTIIVQYPVDTPSVEYKCKDKKAVELNCSISQGSSPELQLLLDGRDKKTDSGTFLSSSFNVKASMNVTCTARNKLGEVSRTKVVSCEGGGLGEWYVYLIAGAGGVAFIVFIILIVYSVKSCRRPKEDLVYNNDRPVMQERQLPQPPIQSVINEGDNLPRRQGAPESAAGGKKGHRPNRPRPPQPPNQQPESLPLKTPGPEKPPLPGNHPNDQPPRPTPRTKSKPPRQKHQRP